MGKATEFAQTIRLDDEEMLAICHAPATPRRNVAIVIVVGGPQYRVGSHRQFVLMARQFAEEGIPVLRFDVRGMGDSAGDQRSFEQLTRDIRAGVDAAAVAFPEVTRFILFGLCDGASAALMYACTDPRIAGLALANPWVRTAQGAASTLVRHYYGSRLLEVSFWKKLLSGRVHLGESIRALTQTLLLAAARNIGRSDFGAKQAGFLEKMLESARTYSGQILIVLSEHDLTAREFEEFVSSSSDWQDVVGRSRCQSVAITGADHTFSGSASRRLAGQKLVAWMDAWLGRRP